MSTNGKWGVGFNPLPNSTMNSKIVFGGLSDINSLGNEVNSLSISGFLFGNWNEFTSSCMAFPFVIEAENNADEGSHYFITSGRSFTNITCKGYMSTDSTRGAYTLGEYKYPKCTSYLDYDPYTSVEIFLPYLGFTEVKIADIDDKYIQFRLNVDWSSGQATYTISTSDVAVNDTGNLPFVDYSDLTVVAKYQQCRVINTFTFQLGYSIPITSTNFNDTIRNIAEMAVKAGGAIVGLATGAGAAVSTTVTSGQKVTRRVNKDTGRMEKASVTDLSKTTTRTTETKGSGVNTAIDTAESVLGGFSSRGSTDKPNNMCLIGNVCRSVAIIKRTVIPTVNRTGTAYKHLVGLPNGKCELLANLSGFTIVTSMHTDGISATTDEVGEIQSLLSEGVIL